MSSSEDLTLAIGETSQVTLHFSLALESGELVDSTFDKTAATFVMGDGSLLQGFEQKLLGLHSGDEREFLILPEEGFGQANPNNIQQMPRDSFAEDMVLEPGLMVSFADANGGELPGVITAFDDDQVQVDFNHPLASKTLTFSVKIIDVSKAPPAASEFDSRDV